MLTTLFSKKEPEQQMLENPWYAWRSYSYIWDCPKIQTFWNNIRNELEKNFKMDLYPILFC